MAIQLVSEEFDGARFGDQRRSARLVWLGDQLAARSDHSLPDALQTEAGLEAGYRFLNNRRVTPSAILAPHIAATAARARVAGHVVVAHDTTLMHFDGRGLGPLRGRSGGEGFYAHMALALAGEKSPLGVVGMRTFQRVERPAGTRKTEEERRADNEMRNWRAVFDDACSALGETPAIHVMDRQADSYELLLAMCPKASVVVRAKHDRVIALDDDIRSRMSDALEQAPIILTRDVALSHRGDGGWNKDRHSPPRDARAAKLSITACSISILRPSNVPKKLPARQPVNVVRVLERDPPDGDAPIEWLLITNLPIDSPEQVATVVDAYRCRWQIEELFKAIKTGCAYEKRQLESEHALLNMLAITIPVAWRLLLIRHVARSAPDANAGAALTTPQLELLAALPRAKLPQNPTAHDAMLAVARLGGHLKRNGDPGWIVLGRGYKELLILEEAWVAARGTAPPRSDQS